MKTFLTRNTSKSAGIAASTIGALSEGILGMNDELKPCPFCGGTNILFHESNRTYQASCVDCEARAQYAYSKKEAVTNWNRRAGDE